jgi:hypothetical protein
VCQGDVRSLHELFRSGEASVFDHDGDGFGLLIMSISPPVDQQPRSLLLSKYATINGMSNCASSFCGKELTRMNQMAGMKTFHEWDGGGILKCI